MWLEMIKTIQDLKTEFKKRYGNIEEDSSLNEDGIEKSMIQIENSKISLISRMNHLEDEISGLKERWRSRRNKQRI